ncbi:MAG: biotin--[acetyl-CoA-carboxylase] ligase [Planctomycetaceae bacterium]
MTTTVRELPVPPFDLPLICRQTGIRHVEYHETLESTNRLAVSLLKPLLEVAPALVLTANQTAGRGRGSNQWWSTAGALTFSIVLDAESMDLPVERRAMISLLTGLAVRNAVAPLVPNRTTAIKWPNDVLVGEQKICGILAEQHNAGDRCGVIIGIGVNVNNSLSPAPMEVRQRAASVFDLTGQHQDLTAVLIAIVAELTSLKQRLSRSPAAVLSEANAASILNGRELVLQTGDRQHAGTCRGIDEDGALVLETAAGTIQRFSGGSVVTWQAER